MEKKTPGSNHYRSGEDDSNMGNRIHKVIGCGFRYSKLDKDPRFTDGIFDLEGDLRPKLIEYLDKLKSEDSVEKFDYSMLEQQLKGTGWFKDDTSKPISMYDVLKYSSYGSEQMATPIIITNPMEKDWYRYDDIIDYYEAPTKDGGPIDHVKLIVDDANQSSGIYPYCARYVNRNAGKVCEKIHTSIRWTTTNACLEAGIKVPFKAENPMGIDGSLIQWQRHIVPQLPPFISIFCDAFNVFKNPMTKYRLRPMILTYWC